MGRHTRTIRKAGRAGVPPTRGAMSALLNERHHELELPEHWPQSLRPEVLCRVDHETPYSICDLDTIRDRYRRLGACLAGIECFYALKCNPAVEVLKTLAELGS